jgi:hypothetical protein
MRPPLISGGNAEFVVDVPPRFKIPAKQLTDYEPLGIALDPIHKEVMFVAAASARYRPANGVMAAVMTFSWPEIF